MCSVLLFVHQSEGLAKIILCRQRYKQKEIRILEEAASKSEEESDEEMSEESGEEEGEARVAVCSRETAFLDSRIRKLVVQIEPISAAVARYGAVAALRRNRVNVNSSDDKSEVGTSDEDELMAALMDADRQEQDAAPTKRLQRRGRAPLGKRCDRCVGWVDDDYNSSSATTSEDDNGGSSDQSGSYQRNPKIKRARASRKQEGIVTDACKKCSRQAVPANYGFCAKHRTSKKNASTAANKRTARRSQQESSDSDEESSGDEEDVRQTEGTEGRAERRARREQPQSSDDDDDDDDESSEEEDDTEAAVPRESKAKAGGGRRKQRKRTDVYNEQLQRWEYIGKVG